jgi:hypothetical protein
MPVNWGGLFAEAALFLCLLGTEKVGAVFRANAV